MPVRVEARGPVVAVSLTAPILSRRRLEALGAALSGLAGDPRPVVLCGDHPRIFLAGADLAEIASLTTASATPYAALGRSVLERIRVHPRPVVAAVHGPCTGGGFDLVLACDGIVAGPRARFAHPGVRRGLVTGWGGTARLPAVASGAASAVAMVAARELAPRDIGTYLIEAFNHDELAPIAAAAARRLAAIDGRRLKLWRELRASRPIDSLRASVVLTEVLAADASGHGRGRR